MDTEYQLTDYGNLAIKRTISDIAKIGNADLSKLLRQVLLQCPSISREDIDSLGQDCDVESFVEVVRANDQRKPGAYAEKETINALNHFYYELLRLKLLKTFAESASGTIFERELFIYGTPNKADTIEPTRRLDIFSTEGRTAEYTLNTLSAAGCLVRKGVTVSDSDPRSWTMTKEGEKELARLSDSLRLLLSQQPS